MVNIYCSETTEFKVAFFDLDPMNVVWHGNYVKYMEIGRCALLDKIGYNYTEMVKSGYAFPVTDIKVRYIKPLYFGEHAKIVSHLVEYENMIKIKYEIFNEKGELTTKAESTQMALNIQKMEAEFSCPEVFVNKVRAIAAK
ncbi:acyl-CoA thioesterase [bacterium]|nr:acyl-CoA thioesterase [bacterium]MBP5592364.1 acyl-CoA thioesterase [bacterium]